MAPQRPRSAHEVAVRQRGLITRTQFVAAGHARSTWHRQRERGALIAITSEVAALPGNALDLRTWILAACLHLGGHAWLRTAAWLHGMWDPIRTIEVVVPRPVARGRGLTLQGGPRVVVRSTTSLPFDDVLVVDGIPTVGVARTLLGLASLAPADISMARLQRTVAGAIDQRIATLPWLWWLLEVRRCHGRNGVRAFEAVLATLSDMGPTESWLERFMLDLLRSRSLPMPVTQRVVRRSGRFVARVDLLWASEHLVVEVLGHAFHRTPADLQRDAERANQLQAAGYRVLQFTYDDLVRRPDHVIALIRSFLA